MAELEGYGGKQVLYEPTYRMKPTEEQRFFPSVARDICEEVIKSHLDGKSWNGEEETVWSVQISEDIKARLRSTFTLTSCLLFLMCSCGQSLTSRGTRLLSKLPLERTDHREFEWLPVAYGIPTLTTTPPTHTKM